MLSGTYVVCTGYETTPGLCHWCGQPVTNKRRRSFCSEECSDQYELHFWWPRAAQGCRERANNLCEWCGAPGQQAHHLDPLTGERRDWSVKNRPENLVLLCNSCHGKAHICAKEEAMTETLEERYRDDPVALELYKKKLLIPGWAGQLDDCEQEYLRRMNPPWYANIRKATTRTRFKQKEGSGLRVQGRLEGFWKEVEDKCSVRGALEGV